MHSNGVPIKKNNKVCKYGPCLCSGKYGRMRCSQLFPSFPCGPIIRPCPVEPRSSMACALGDEMLMEVMCHFQGKALWANLRFTTFLFSLCHKTGRVTYGDRSLREGHKMKLLRAESWPTHMNISVNKTHGFVSHRDFEVTSHTVPFPSNIIMAVRLENRRNISGPV